MKINRDEIMTTEEEIHELVDILYDSLSMILDQMDCQQRKMCVTMVAEDTIKTGIEKLANNLDKANLNQAYLTQRLAHSESERFRSWTGGYNGRD